MSSVPVIIVGKMQTGDGGEAQDVTITGLASVACLGVGGGPVIPPAVPPNYPNVPPHPAFPIWGGPGAGFPGGPGYPPVVGGGPTYPPWWPGFPAHPIPPTIWPTPPEGGGGQPPESTTPPIEWKVAWSPETGWIVVGIPTGEHPTPSAASST
jgi:hypothetical protein